MSPRTSSDGSDLSRLRGASGWVRKNAQEALKKLRRFVTRCPCANIVHIKLITSDSKDFDRVFEILGACASTQPAPKQFLHNHILRGHDIAGNSQDCRGSAPRESKAVILFAGHKEKLDLEPAGSVLCDQARRSSDGLKTELRIDGELPPQFECQP